MRPRVTWLLVLAVAACGGDPPDEPVVVTPAPPGEPYETLAPWGLFADPVAQSPSDRVEPYQVISPLYSDYTFKRRFAWIPEGTTVGYQDEAKWAFPVGTILVKTFSYLKDMRDASLGERLLETRLMVRETAESWETYIYVWNEAQTQAVLEVAGKNIPSEWIHGDGNKRENDYIVPNTNECQECHGNKDDGLLDTLGGRTRQLDRDGQLERFAELGWFDQVPPSEREALVDPFDENASLAERARSYLDSNCGHCHTENGPASQSALWLSYDFTDPAVDDEANWGVCKQPTSAGGATCGNTFDIVPGDPSSSIFICRLTAAPDELEVRMPPLVSRVTHDEGVALVSAWIAAMEPPGCNPM